MMQNIKSAKAVKGDVGKPLKAESGIRKKKKSTDRSNNNTAYSQLSSNALSGIYSFSYRVNGDVYGI